MVIHADPPKNLANTSDSFEVDALRYVRLIPFMLFSLITVCIRDYLQTDAKRTSTSFAVCQFVPENCSRASTIALQDTVDDC